MFLESLNWIFAFFYFSLYYQPVVVVFFNADMHRSSRKLQKGTVFWYVRSRECGNKHDGRQLHEFSLQIYLLVLPRVPSSISLFFFSLPGVGWMDLLLSNQYWIVQSGGCIATYIALKTAFNKEFNKDRICLKCSLNFFFPKALNREKKSTIKSSNYLRVRSHLVALPANYAWVWNL